MIKIVFFFVYLFSLLPSVSAQKIDDIINPKEVERIEKVLAADDMHGRRVFTPDIDKAADFIINEFKSIGLQTLNNSGSYRQEFSMIRPKFISVSAKLDAVAIDSKNIIVVTCQPELKIDQTSGYEIAVLKPGGSLRQQAASFIQANKNLLVMVDESFAASFSRLISLKRVLFKTNKNVIFVLGNNIPQNFSIEAKHDITEEKAANIVGVLPGKSRSNEYVIFSGHYDHVGTGSPAEAYRHDDKDSIYNGANDNASGTTAVIMLAKYF
ncbi:MAG: M28 family peptidase, partial [Bacteroidota bacterium]